MSSYSSSNGTKRNNEDSQRYYSGSVNNGAKKMKTEAYQQHQVSKVVHLRSLPTDVSDTEVIRLGMTFGRVVNVLMLKGKNQAFLEMEDEEIATNMVKNSEMNPPTIRQRIIYIQFSNHKELKTDTSPNQMRAQAVLQALQQTEGGQNHVLRAVVENMIYPITIDVLHTIFSKFGVVLKIITFNKANQFQALVQMGDAAQSQSAKMSLDNQNIYNGCCTLRIDYSRLDSLNVKFNNDKSRDFTRSDLPSGNENPVPPILGSSNPLHLLTGLDQGLMSAPYQNAFAALVAQSQLANMNSPGNAGGGQAPADPDFKGCNSLPPQITMGQPLQRLLPGRTPTRPSGLNNQLQHHPLSQQQQQQPGLNNPLPTFQSQSAMQPYNQFSHNSVLHVSNLNEEMVTAPDTLFMLFGVYGDVMRVKILFQKKSSALVQMHDGNQAQLVRKFLHGVRLFGRPLNIVISKHTQVQLPKEGLDAENLTQDYTNSPLHRFKKPGSKNFQNIFPPSEVLHLSNIPSDVSEEFLKELFTKHGEVHGFKFFVRDRKMAVIKMTNVDEAIQCLVYLHNYKLSETSHLRVSFSKGHL